MKKLNNKRAFTIVELIIVIAVIGVLAAILIPAFTNIIAKANYKSAISDARGALTNFLAANLEVVDGTHVKHIAIFVKKADKYYAFGYTSDPVDPHAGKLTESYFSPFSHDSLIDMISDYGCSPTDVDNGDIGGKGFCLIPAGGKSKSVPSSDEEVLNQQYQNAVDLLADLNQNDLPESTMIFNGYLLPNTIMPVSDQVYKISLTLYNEFSNTNIGQRHIFITLPPETTSFTLDSSNFFDYLNESGYILYPATDDTPEFSQEFTFDRLQMYPKDIGRVCVAPVEIINGEEYIKVSSAADFGKINEKVSNMSKNFKITNRIDFNNANVTPIGKIGGQDVPFTGKIDGGNFELYRPRIERSDDNVGLVAINSGTIKNVYLNRDGSQSRKIKGVNNVGGIAGRNVGGTIYYCTVKSYFSDTLGIYFSVEGTGQNIGLIAGTNEEGGVIDYCNTTYNNHCLRGSTAGGIVGFNGVNSVVSRCFGYGLPVGYSGATRLGGVVGYNLGTVEESWVHTFYAYMGNNTETKVGGIVGEVSGSTPETPGAQGIVRNCYVENPHNTENIIGGKDYVGGIIGYATAATVENCYSYIGNNLIGENYVNKGIAYITPESENIAATVVRYTYVATYGTIMYKRQPHNVTAVKGIREIRNTAGNNWNWSTIWKIDNNIPKLRNARTSSN